jgi:hypothetical protein
MMTLRLLMPPGVCACKLGGPAGRMLAGLLNAQPADSPVEPEENEDHDPGCPASRLAAGMGLVPASVLLLLDIPATDAALWTPTPVLTPPPDSEGVVAFAIPPADPIYYLAVRALRV